VAVNTVLSIAESHRLWFIVPVVLLVLGAWWYERRRHRAAAARLGELPVLSRMLVSVSPGRRLLKALLLATATVLLVIAIAEPQRASTDEEEKRGLDLVIAMDVSKSMLVPDVAPDRLARARELALQTLDGLPGDRSAAVVFAGAASHFPLTEDHEVTAQFLQDLGPADLPGGSNFAEALRLARCILRRDVGSDLGCGALDRKGRGGDPLPGEDDERRDEEIVIESEERGRAIVVFTDGGEPDDKTRAEVQLVKDLGISLYVVGVGTTAGGEVWDIDDDGRRTRPKRDRAGKPIISSRNDAGLTELATLGGDASRYYVGAETGTPDATSLVASLTTLQRGILKKTVRRRHGIQTIVLFPALVLLLVEAVISTRRRVATADGRAIEPRPRRRRRGQRPDDDDAEPVFATAWAPGKVGLAVGAGLYLATLIFLVIYHQVSKRKASGFSSGELTAAVVMLGVAIVAGLGAAWWARKSRGAAAGRVA
jgi:Ca-activated chloride channel family protein